jgi:hypothetical protein
MDSLAPMVDNGRMSSDGRRKVVSSGGDLYLIDMGAGTSRQLTQTFDIESNPTFSTDGREIFFVRSDNVYSIAIDGGLIRQLTDIRVAGAAAPTPAPVAGGRGGAAAEEEEAAAERIQRRHGSTQVSAAFSSDSSESCSMSFETGRVTTVCAAPIRMREMLCAFAR